MCDNSDIIFMVHTRRHRRPVHSPCLFLFGQLCFDTCARKSSLYMGLLKGNECGCGEDPSFLATDKADGVCDAPCPGDEVQTCGGALAYDLFELMDDDTNDDVAGDGACVD